MNPSKQLNLELISTRDNDVTVNNLTFNFDDKQIRVIMIDDKPHFIGTEICSILEHTDTSKAISRLDDDEKLTRTLFASGQNRLVNLITESGLYSLILTSRLPSAKAFKKWVTSEVLPSIRKTGQYGQKQPIPKTYKEALLELVSQIEEKERLEAENQILAPKAESFDKFMNSDGCFLIRDVAKMIHTKQNPCGELRLFEFLRNNRYLNIDNIPYQKYIELDWFRLIPKTYYDRSIGDFKAYTQLYVTPKGVEAIRKLWEGK